MSNINNDNNNNDNNDNDNDDDVEISANILTYIHILAAADPEQTDWGIIKRAILIMMPNEEKRTAFTPRDYHTRMHLPGKIEKKIFKIWKELTGNDLVVNKPKWRLDGVTGNPVGRPAKGTVLKNFTAAERKKIKLETKNKRDK